MPKQYHYESVLHDWVHALPFQMQALLLTAMRGPDACPKHNHAKSIVRYLREAVIKPAGYHTGNDNDFMWGDWDRFTHSAVAFWENHDEYPHHFIMHLVHCAQVVGYKHPDSQIRAHWAAFYLGACDSFHMMPESEEAMDERLNDFGVGVHNNKV